MNTVYPTNSTHHTNNTRYIMNENKYYPLPLHPNDWISIYIPHLDITYTQSKLKDILENKYSIGKVSYIDFIKNTSRNGVKNGDYSAFVHFEMWYNSDFAIYLRHHLNKYEKYDISKYYTTFKLNASSKSREDKNNHNTPNDHFHILINRSMNYQTHHSKSNSSYMNMSGSEQHYSFVQTQPPQCMNSIMDILEKHTRRIDLLEQEIEALRDIIRNK